MGLDVDSRNHDFRAGSYSGFGTFRDWLAVQIGYTNYDSYWDQNAVMLKDWNNKCGMSKGAGDVPLGPIMGHSDCDGFIPARYTKKLGEELQAIKDKLIEEGKWHDTVADSFTGSNDENIEFTVNLNDWIIACQSNSNINFH